MLLTGILRCGGCGAAMTQMTGKGGRYVYYCCANRKRTGNAVCGTRSVPQSLVEDAVCRSLTEQILTPEHIDELVAACVSRARAQSDTEARTRKAQKALHDVEASLGRLYQGVAAGTLDPGEPLLKGQIDALKLRRSEARLELDRCQALQGAALTPPSPEKIAKFAESLREGVTQGEIPLRKAYIRAFVEEITVKPGQIIISGRKDVLASAAAKGKLGPSGTVPSFVPEWRARQESNLRPPA